MHPEDLPRTDDIVVIQEVTAFFVAIDAHVLLGA